MQFVVQIWWLVIQFWNPPALPQDVLLVGIFLIGSDVSLGSFAGDVWPVPMLGLYREPEPPTQSRCLLMARFSSQGDTTFRLEGQRIFPI